MPLTCRSGAESSEPRTPSLSLLAGSPLAARADVRQALIVEEAIDASGKAVKPRVDGSMGVVKPRIESLMDFVKPRVESSLGGVKSCVDSASGLVFARLGLLEECVDVSCQFHELPINVDSERIRSHAERSYIGLRCRGGV